MPIHTAQINLNHQRCISQDGSVKSDTHKGKKMRHNISSGYLKANTLFCKMLVVFGICFIIGCYLIPVIVYYVGRSMDRGETDPEFSFEKNVSTAKVCY